MKKNENTNINPCETLNPNVPNVLIVELVDFNSPVNQDEIIKVHT